MLNEFIREQDEKQARLKQQRINSEKAKTTKTASIQCDRRDVLEKSDRVSRRNGRSEGTNQTAD